MTESRSPSLLLQSQFETLQRVSQVLSRSLDFPHTLREVLRTLEITGHLSRGMVGVVDPDAATSACTRCTDSNPTSSSRPLPARRRSARRGPGEWPELCGRPTGRRAALPRPARALRAELPFIAVPILFGGALQGVLAVQPDEPDDGLLDERVHFVELLANLIGQSVRLALEVTQEGQVARPGT
jgi:Nif-specific regulatory protein